MELLIICKSDIIVVLIAIGARCNTVMSNRKPDVYLSRCMVPSLCGAVADIGNVTGKIDVGENDMNHLLREDTLSYGDYDYDNDNDNDYNSNDFQSTDATLKISTAQYFPRGSKPFLLLCRRLANKRVNLYIRIPM